jgi:hypothetical protein
MNFAAKTNPSLLSLSLFILIFSSLAGCSDKKHIKDEDNGLAGVAPKDKVVLDQLNAGSDKLPVISNFSLDYDHDNQTLKVAYDVQDAEQKAVSVQAYYFTAQGNFIEPFDGPVKGDVGDAIPVGTGKKIEIPFTKTPGRDSITVALLVDDKIVFPISAYISSVDTSALKRDVEAVYGIRHRVSNPTHLASVRLQLKDSLAKYGYDVISQKFTYKEFKGENIIGRKPGYGNNRKKVVICAHYDTVIDSPGADDNGSGIAALLEMARILASMPAENAIEIVFFDLEEAGMIGSRQYVAFQDSLKNEDIVAAINLDMIGYMSTEKHSQAIPETIALAFPRIKQKVEDNEGRGDFILCIANESSSGLRDEFTAQAAKYLPERKVISILTPGKSEVVPYLRYSDHSSFWDKNYPAIFIGDGSDSRNLNYHSPQDTIGTLNYPFMKDATETILSVALETSGTKHGSMVWKTIKL